MLNLTFEWTYNAPITSFETELPNVPRIAKDAEYSNWYECIWQTLLPKVTYSDFRLYRWLLNVGQVFKHTYTGKIWAEQAYDYWNVKIQLKCAYNAKNILIEQFRNADAIKRKLNETFESNF